MHNEMDGEEILANVFRELRRNKHPFNHLYVAGVQHCCLPRMFVVGDNDLQLQSCWQVSMSSDLPGKTYTEDVRCVAMLMNSNTLPEHMSK